MASQNLLYTGWFGLKNAWRCSVSVTISSLAVLAVASLIPGLQVILITRLVNAVSTGQSPTELTSSLIGVAISIAAAEPLAQIVRALGYQAVSQIRAALHGELAHAVAAMPPSMLRRPEVADRIQAVKDSIPMQAGYVYLNLLIALQGIISAVGVCVAVFTFSIFAGILVLLAAFPVYLASSSLNRLQARMDKPLSVLSRRASYLETLITHQRSASELNSLGTGQRVASWVTGQYQSVAKYESGLLRPLLRAQTAAGAATGALVAAALLVLVTQKASAGAAAGVVAAVAGAGAIRSAGFSLASLAEAAPRVARFRQLLRDTPPAAQQIDPPDIASIEATELAFTYEGASRAALRGVSFSARKGEMIALVGPNGAGKTTAVNCLTGALHPTSGRVLIDGRDASRMEEPERLSMFGTLSQEFGRFEVPVRDAVGLGQPNWRLSDSGLMNALTGAQASDLVMTMPNDLDTQLGDQWENGVGVSGGEWQRLALARIYARNAPIWVLDEPTSAIDAEAEYEVFTELQQTRADRITIVVSHRAWTLREMDRIYVLDDGRIVESGPFDQLVNAGGRFAALFRSQMATSAD
jgi:ATP-binding cassette, subfamily B, bacterial